VSFKRLSPGIYSKDGALHIDAAEFLIANGFEPTDENAETLARMAERVVGETAAKSGKPMEFVVSEDIPPWRGQG
jgi:hypothetical protein